MTGHNDELTRIAITVDIPAEPGDTHLGVTALLDVLTHLHRQGVEPQWVTLDIAGPSL